MTEVEKPADTLANGGGVASLTVLMPECVREELERAAQQNERSAGAEVRVALRAWLGVDERDHRPA